MDESLSRTLQSPGFEPWTSGLEARYATTQPLPRKHIFYFVDNIPESVIFGRLLHCPWATDKPGSQPTEPESFALAIARGCFEHLSGTDDKLDGL
ncbi:hypothetical protein TNCV_4696251 [Trichonephila clavipes]|nr:hypothetical protein TNCV_4696251 [Trichonephila clavipes]